MDIGKAFSYVFEDPKWVTKVLIAGILLFPGGLLIIPAFITLGYVLQTVRNLRTGLQYPLPEWTDFGAFLVDGLKFFVVLLVYLIPYIVLSAIGGSGSNISFLFSCLGFIYYLVFLVALPAIVGKYLDSGSDIGASLRVQEVIAEVQRSPSDYVIVGVMSFVASIIGGLGAIACLVGLIFTLPYAYLIQAHLWYQITQKMRGSGGATPMIGNTPL